MLDRYQLAGVIASWWGDVQYDIRTLAYHKFSGVVQGWLTTIEAAFDTEGEENVRNQQRLAAEKRRAREHSPVSLLIPDYLNALEQAEAHRADLDAQVKAATAKPAEDEGDVDDDVSAETSLSLEELKKLKSDLAAARKEVKRLEADFLNQLKDKIGGLNASTEEDLVRKILKADLKNRLDTEFAVGPRMLADRYRTWADKYAVPLLAIQALNSSALAARIKAATQGVTRDRINLASLLSIYIPVPPLSFQHDMMHMLDAQKQAVHAIGHELDKLRIAKQGVVDDLLTGRIRVPPR